jgi:8-oxo-dGTP pyrophosphatase MutT (NUDIX family)
VCYLYKTEKLMGKQIVREKVLVVPYVVSYDFTKRKNIIHFLMVKDRSYHEWGFISGGVKHGENNFDAAMRELKEETSGLLKLPYDNMKFRFTSKYRTKEHAERDKRRNEKVKNNYTVYIFSWRDLYRLKKHIEGFVENEEVIDIAVRPYEEFEDVWSFCQDIYEQYVLPRCQIVATHR